MGAIDAPTIFIGSSTEGLAVARVLEVLLSESARVSVWPDAFDLGETNVEALFDQLDSSDYAVLVATRDDKVRSRGSEKPAARDNVVFEAGLFMGRLGRRRAFLVSEEALRLPSDLAGVTVATFARGTRAQKSSLERAAEKILQCISKGQEREVDFLHAYLTFIDPVKTELGHTYAEILRTHYDKISSELKSLHSRRDWHRLLEVKRRLREYFEYSGMYREGVEFGRGYVAALGELDRLYDAAWSQVKDVGYMLILTGDYGGGRTAIHKVIDNPDKWGLGRASDLERAKLLFYANRYLCISYYRDRANMDLSAARRHLAVAREQLSFLDADSAAYREVQARLLRNEGHVELADNNPAEAIRLYKLSLDLFERTEDEEHKGTGRLTLAKALIGQGAATLDEAYLLLKRAEVAFWRIGWNEGQARVQEQLARYWVALATRRGIRREDKRRMLMDADLALNQSQVLFERIHSGRFEGRLDDLRGQWYRAVRIAEQPRSQRACLPKDVPASSVE